MPLVTWWPWAATGYNGRHVEPAERETRCVAMVSSESGYAYMPSPLACGARQKLWAPLNPLRPPSAHCASPKPVDPLTPQDMSVEDMAVVCVHNIPPQPESPRRERLENPQCRGGKRW